MLAILLLLFFFLSGDFIAIILFNRRFGEFTIVTVFGLSFILYCFGLIHLLTAGVWVIFIIVSLMYLVGIISIVKRGIRRISFSPVFICFSIVIALTIWGDYAQLANGSDDIEHWMDCVKTMIHLDDFYANPVGHSSFGTYPPFMAMIQFLIQKLNMAMTGKAFCEWLNFVIYHISIFVLFLPSLIKIEENSITCHCESKHKLISSCFTIIMCAAIFLLSTTVFFRGLFSSTMIDPFLSIAAGVMFILINQKKEICSSYILCFLIPGLVLTKDLGLLFAAFGLILLYIRARKEKRFKVLIISTVSSLFAKISWEIVKGINHTIDAKPNSVNWVTYIKALLGSYDGLEEYKIESISNYRLALFHKTETIGNDYFSIEASFFVFIILLLLIYVIWYNYKRKQHEEGLLLSNCIIYISMLLFFIFGLGGVYMDKFVYTESVALASYPRYMNTVINILLIEIVIMLLLHYGGRKLNVISIMLVLMVIISPINNWSKYIKREYYIEEESARHEADEFAYELLNTCEKGSKVYLVSQGTYGDGWRDYLVAKFLTKPYLTFQSTEGNNYNWSFIEKKNPDDIYTKEMTPEQWSKELFNEDGYDYVAIAKPDTFFQDTFISLFQNTEVIAPHSIYMVDKEKQLLIPVK